MSSSISNSNPNVTTLDTTTNKVNPSNIFKFELSLSVTQHIYSRLILNNIYIDDFTIFLGY